MSMSKRVKIYTAEDLAQHKSTESCWVSRNGKVYDITTFLPDHPGGDDIVLKYAGGDIDAIMKDPREHQHSDSAYDVLDEYLIGRVGSGENIVDENWEAPDDFHPENTDPNEDFKRNEFLDLKKALIPQLWRANFSKSYYLQQVHQPRHLPTPAILFGPEYLEIFTVTQWWVIPLIWLPITGYIFLRSLLQYSGVQLLPFYVQPALPMHLLKFVPQSAYIKTGICFFVGNIIWTILEYVMHRFLFHIDEALPDKPIFLLLHFLTHGVHHFLPMDRLRLVMPPVLFTLLQSPFTKLAHTIFPTAMANGIISGAFAFYVLYDMTHYAVHHTHLPDYLREMKKYHLAHHYKNYELAFGVTSKIWDIVFGTVLPV